MKSSARPVKPLMRIAIRTQDEDAWRAIAGQDDIESWCAAHGWSAAEIASGSVVVTITPDDVATVTARRVLRDEDGKPLIDPDDENSLASEIVTAPLARPLPKGVGEVSED